MAQSGRTRPRWPASIPGSMWSRTRLMARLVTLSSSKRENRRRLFRRRTGSHRLGRRWYDPMDTSPGEPLATHPMLPIACQRHCAGCLPRRNRVNRVHRLFRRAPATSATPNDTDTGTPACARSPGSPHEPPTESEPRPDHPHPVKPPPKCSGLRVQSLMPSAISDSPRPAGVRREPSRAGGAVHFVVLRPDDPAATAHSRSTRADVPTMYRSAGKQRIDQPTVPAGNDCVR